MPREPPEQPRPGKGALYLRWLGGILTLLSVGWVLSMVARNTRQIAGVIEGSFLVGLVVATCAYTVLLCLASFAWWWLTAAYGKRPPAALGMSLWARSQVGKYLPGNVFHYLGRQALGRRHGLGHATLGAASILELISFLLAASVLAILGLCLRGRQGETGMSLLLVVVALVVALLAWPVADGLLRRIRDTWDWRPLRSLPPFGGLRLLALPFLLHVLFLLCTGGLLFGLLRIGWPEARIPFYEVLWLYPLAWTAGTLMPGSPGGLGVREAVLVVELDGAMGEGSAAALAIGLRIVTLLGDGLLSAIAWPVYSRWAGATSPSSDPVP